LIPFRVTVSETDLLLQAVRTLEPETRESVVLHRGYLEAYIQENPSFRTTLAPWRLEGPAATIVRDMAEAGRVAGTGPMAAVAGAIAERVGRDLLRCSPEVIVENGGDIFLKVDGPVVVAVFAGASPLSMRVGMRLDPGAAAMGVCTSSGTVGHSMSLGRADAVCVVSDSCALADAAATAIGNRVRGPEDIPDALAFAENLSGIAGSLIICEEKAGVWGRVEIVPLEKKGVEFSQQK
jgi:ApbE superfamily uncharacterized protein (UPF0280 family)